MTAYGTSLRVAGRGAYLPLARQGVHNGHAIVLTHRNGHPPSGVYRKP